MAQNGNEDRPRAKKAAAVAALALVQDGMSIGLGSGSTASYFLEALIQRVKEGLRVHALATSIEIEKRARTGGIVMLDEHKVERLDLTVDGADEFDRQKRLVKGGGGALFREKIVAAMSGEMVVIVDESKQVEKLGAIPLPVEILPFGSAATIEQLKNCGFSGSLRHNNDGMPYRTDNGNYIYDVACSHLYENPDEIDRTIIAIPGTIATGLFLDLAGRIIVGCYDGTVQIYS